MRCPKCVQLGLPPSWCATSELPGYCGVTDKSGAQHGPFTLPPEPEEGILL